MKQLYQILFLQKIILKKGIELNSERPDAVAYEASNILLSLNGTLSIKIDRRKNLMK
jgi:hypothetical protein